MKIDLLSWLLFPQAGADQRWNQGGGANHKSRPGVIWASGCVHLIVLGGGHLYQVLQEVDRFTRFSEQAVVRCIEAGTNLSLALTLTHHILNQTVLHLLNVHVHGPGQFLEFDKPEYVMSLRENQPPGGDQGWSCHPVRSQRESEVRILFVPRQILDQVLDQDQLRHKQHCQCHPHHSQTSGSRQEDICRSQVGKIWLCWY